MQNLLTSSQMRSADAHTLTSGPMASVDLMEAACRAFTDCFFKHFPYSDTAVSVYCGTGNNGGDGLAIARMLAAAGYPVTVKVAFFSSRTSPDFDINLQRLAETGLSYTAIRTDDMGEETADVIIDALLGSGLNKPLTGHWESLARYLNGLSKTVVAVDVPTGMPCDGDIQPGLAAIKADLAISFQRPKLSFFFPGSAAHMERFEVVDIGLDEAFIEAQPSGFKLLQQQDIRDMLRPRKPFSHKGTYGHALILAGAKETMGAALLCAAASLYTGSGLTTACIPSSGLTALNTAYPEVMALLRDEGFSLPDTDAYTAIAIGPGLGKGDAQTKLLHTVLASGKPLVLDADALNIISENAGSLAKVPKGTVLTPHMKEFDRLFGPHASWWERVATARQQAKALGIIIVLKNRYSFIALPTGRVLINLTGGPNMATGGMGDVLTGMIVSFMAQGYGADEAAMLAAYIHGLCGERHGGWVCRASELVREIPAAMNVVQIII